MNFKQFTQSKELNAWIKEGKLYIYVRRTPPKYEYIWGNYQLANLHSSAMGTGSLSAFLNKWEPHYIFYIENLLNPRLTIYFKKRGYTQTNQHYYPPCLIGPTPRVTE